MIRWVYELGLSQRAYSLFGTLGLLAMLGFNFFRGKRYGISGFKNLWMTLAVYVPIGLWVQFYAKAETGFQNGGYVSIVRGYVYIPLVIFLLGKIVKIPWKTLCDDLIPGWLLMAGISYVGCMFAGCCHGYECSWGIYNGLYGKRMFPTQLLDMLNALPLFVGLVLRSKRKGYKPDGLLMPMMLICFGTGRFFIEFLRDSEKLWLGCSSISFHSLFMVTVGLDMFFSIREQEKARKNARYQQKTKRRSRT